MISRFVMKSVGHGIQSRTISTNIAYNGWIETMISPLSSSISPLQRISQMYCGGNDRWRFTKDIDDMDDDLNIKAIEIWEKPIQRSIHSAFHDIANRWIVLKLKNSNSCFLLNRVVSGVQLSRLPLNKDGQTICKCNLFKPDEMLKLKCYKNKKKSSMNRFAEYVINKQSK
eukprot:527052_1